MADDTKRDENGSIKDTGVEAATPTDSGAARGLFGQPDMAGQPGGLNQGTTPPLTAEQEAALIARRAKGNAVDDNAASHQGGMGAQSGQADYGSAGNLAGE